ncbi:MULTISPECIES: hypothetical protein [unclassified Frigoribacterium]|jgi:hypothetical protein|uniref:hypothetical protein n=1 Tax=unclassified Frigoribacterium TaxID=2627005 RepID=UPI0006F45967|nr:MULTISPECIES: hypothetical protein [unclassified Frigoribacterium]KQS17129.1 hypothetical protein ASG05_06210 [Frigoribacterium sp. Leaf186]MBF4600941.1 hypothetical protein [Frigoribacterium sp. VKM Ac-1396]
MADLIVDGEALKTSIDALARVRDELDHQASGKDENKDIFGQATVNKAMHDFSGNWKIHRGKIKDNVSKLHDKLQQMHDEWDKADASIADGLKTETV